MKFEPIIAAPDQSEPLQREQGFYPSADCPRWLPLALLAGLAFYPIAGLAAYLLL